MERITCPDRLAELLDPSGGATVAVPTGSMHYSLRGEPRLGTVLLIAGLSMQRTDWSPELLAGLHAAGYATLCADNRDSGLSRLGNSSAPGQSPPPAPARGPAAPQLQPPAQVPAPQYTLDDMAADLEALIEALGLAPVHAVGMSMGGMIAQHLALRAPAAVRSLTSVMSTTGARGVGRPQPDSKWVFLTPAPTESERAYLEYAERYHLALAGLNFPDLPRALGAARVAWGRGVSPEGTARQLAAIGADGDRTDRLAGIRTPTLVIHGDADPLIALSGGEATAAAIPDARLATVKGMGHTVPWQRADAVTALLVRHFAAAAR